MKRLLVTGGNGFVGRHLLHHLNGTTPETEILAPSLDITNHAAIEALIETTKPDALLHLAGISAVGQAAEAPERAWAVNLHGTLHLAQSILIHAPACQFIFISSAEIYGRAFLRHRPVTEETAPAPTNLYAATKAATEMALGAMPGLRLLRLRPANHTGPGQSPAFVIPAFARQIARVEAGLQPPVLQSGSLEAQRDFLDVRDICAAYGKVLALPNGGAGEVLNLASGTPRRIGDLLDILLGMTRADIRLEIDQTRLRPTEIPVAQVSAARARACLDWRQTIPIEETLATTLAFWRKKVVTEVT
ncbi:GDP-mannose 4,6-dehydratase [Acidocella sp.]|uniref:GDP-mannose 4,6-dehydratase n=1 Tax=Acidocella sp. TaxID=50710 RepID=UPI003D026320